MFLKEKPLSAKLALLALGAGLGVLLFVFTLRSTDGTTDQVSVPAPAGPPAKPEFVRGVHLTSWVAGSKKGRERINVLLNETEINTVVVAIKEYQGEVYIPGVPAAEKYKTNVNALPDIQDYVAQLKKQGVYTIARVVVFKDGAMAHKRPEIAVKRPDGSVWTDHKGNAWLDPYNKQAWEYNFQVASRAIALGFQEIQFDYIRFPSDGDIKQCRYSYAAHNSSSAARALDDFLKAASQRLKPLGASISIDVFGLTPSVQHDMGIGQKFQQMTEWVDFVSPMIYPSHYAKGEYGIPNPNSEPYRVVYRTMSDAKRRLGEHSARLRPYLQDFSLGYKYGAKEVRAQILACEDLGFKEWLLWNPNCNYNRAALKSKSGVLSEAARVPPSMIVRPAEKPAKVQASTAPAPAAEPKTPAKD